ncbi:MBL fold metallo-hydrolase [Candidatus Aminicenantes bacterium AC-708-M15]|jgi:L-ascorbate metabolism protein UlaG (beta-lactamase superfamily)|nr:MBL fold metallo-hydrolase [SCandidatus Aminicenantes bacterium Aminicenantia_JdfR_composite]MCP2597449.1 MBL fold metallo-hydrolase [Candidatus Aminicenantes bacterium AC-335-G13]MCP2604424.1 MBL fold metallo-hydrolase [Candidatus Aminicenantes bacterium AC-708-M15]MCP2606286.1 MBL fold metallo-hydrolase [Candidatus Aminicenantes bacterium AC-708-I09]MCP2619210.1 MBL fold metallo-hydrolase [Candidatus Aminicenantes bacterium AC-335-K20]MCP2620867.1 MBL fold metallo-hydrolase [Candidatus Am
MNISDDIEKFIEKLVWYGHASFKIKNKKVIYIDPWQLPKDVEKADIILVTHSHFDHLSVEDIRHIKKDDTIIVIPPDGASKLMGNIKEIGPGEEIEVINIKIKAVPAYNVNKEFHPKRNEWVGYIIDFEGIKIYHAGDTDFIPEMKELGPVDIALLPVGGKYTMNAEEAADAAEAIKPKIAIPMHYGAGVVGTLANAEKFKQLLTSKINVKILSPKK